MSDTTPDVGRSLTALFMERTASERAMMAFEMFDLARSLMMADILARHPGLTDVELRVHIFDRTYGGDFDAADRARVVERIREEALRLR